MSLNSLKPSYPSFESAVVGVSMPELVQKVESLRSVVRDLQHPYRHVECSHCGANLESTLESCPNCDHGEPTTFDLE